MTDFPERSAALLIGLSYDNIPDSTLPVLAGPPHDLKHLETVLRLLKLKDIDVVTDVNDWTQGTRANITNKMVNICKRSRDENLDFLLIYFSGHGTRINVPMAEDPTARPPLDENLEYAPGQSQPFSNNLTTGLDEGIAGTDYAVNGPLLDNTIRTILSQVNASTTLLVIFDCCNSGTMCDLQYEYYTAERRLINNNAKPIKGKNIISLSGCMDQQLSSELGLDDITWFVPTIPNQTGRTGILTGILSTLIIRDPDIFSSAFATLHQIQDFIKNNQVDPSNLYQSPMLSSSYKMSELTPLLPLKPGQPERSVAFGFTRMLLLDYAENQSMLSNCILLASTEDKGDYDKHMYSNAIAESLLILASLYWVSRVGKSASDKKSLLFSNTLMSRALAVRIKEYLSDPSSTNSQISEFWTLATSTSKLVTPQVFTQDLAAAFNFVPTATRNNPVALANMITAYYTTNYPGYPQTFRLQLQAMILNGEFIYWAKLPPSIFQSVLEYLLDSNSAHSGRNTLANYIQTEWTNQALADVLVYATSMDIYTALDHIPDGAADEGKSMRITSSIPATQYSQNREVDATLNDSIHQYGAYLAQACLDNNLTVSFHDSPTTNSIVDEIAEQLANVSDNSLSI